MSMDLLESFSNPGYDRFENDAEEEIIDTKLREPSVSFVSKGSASHGGMSGQDTDTGIQPHQRSLPPGSMVVSKRHLILLVVVVIVICLVISLVISLSVALTLKPSNIEKVIYMNISEATEDILPKPGSSTYVRWGRTTCPDNGTSELIYSGRVGGQFYTERGGGSNYLCMPMDPQYAGYTLVNENRTEMRNYIHGSEYEKEDRGVYPFSDEFTDTLDDRDVPCAVCLAKERPAMVMVPARTECYQNWTLEYTGFLMSEWYTDSRTEFICVDRAPEVVANSSWSFDGVGLFLVEGACGSLPCPPYTPDKELTCVVCTL